MTEKNFLLDFTGTLSIIDFMKVWNHYDSDKSGYLEGDDFFKFVRDLLEQTDMPSDDDSVETYKAALLDTYDVDDDGNLGLYELINILPIEQNFLSKMDGENNLNKEQVDEVFKHYDDDGNGVIEGEELLGLVHDLMRAKEPDTDIDAAAVAEYREVVLGITGSLDGRLGRQALAVLFDEKPS